MNDGAKLLLHFRYNAQFGKYFTANSLHLLNADDTLDRRGHDLVCVSQTVPHFS